MDGFCAQLKEIIRPDCKSRPFVCDGFPCQSEAIIIGKNPATVMEGEPWGNWWDDRAGFNFKDFIKKYKQIRRQDRGREMSPTRFTMQRFRDNGVLCVETNVYRNEGVSRERKGKISNVDVLLLLLDNMPKLRAAIICGGEARKVVAQHQELRDKLHDLANNGMIRIDVDRLYSAGYEWIDARCDEIKAKRLDKCPQCRSDLPSQCLENRSGT